MNYRKKGNAEGKKARYHEERPSKEGASFSANGVAKKKTGTYGFSA